MAVEIKALANGQLSDTDKTMMYTVPEDTTTIVKNIRLANTDTSKRTVNLWFKRSGGTARLISASDMSLAPGMFAVDDQEITMEEGDQIQGDADVEEVVDYVISGVEKAVS